MIWTIRKQSYCSIWQNTNDVTYQNQRLSVLPEEYPRLEAQNYTNIKRQILLKAMCLSCSCQFLRGPYRCLFWWSTMVTVTIANTTKAIAPIRTPIPQLGKPTGKTNKQRYNRAGVRILEHFKIKYII